jgi:CSLREA domain-containing protein
MIHTGRQSVETWWIDLGAVLWLVLAMVLCSLAWPGGAGAATIVVNSLADTVVSGDGVCTLREAVLNAERDNRSGSADCAAGNGADTITFSLTGTISLVDELGFGFPGIDSAGGLTIDGGGGITITFSSGLPLFSVGSAGVLTLDNLTIGGGGSAITNNGIMTISHSTVSGFDQGGIFNNGTMTINDSTISNNTINMEGIPLSGIGIHNIGTLTMSTSTVNGNTFHQTYHAGYIIGSAIYNGREGTLTISTSTVSGTRGNGGRGDGFGSGIYNEGTLTIHSSTVSDNSGPQGLTGIFNSGTVKLHSSLIADGCSTLGRLPCPECPYHLSRL